VLGLGLTDAALFAARAMLGVFFILARFRFFYDPSRPECCWFNGNRCDSLASKMLYCSHRVKGWGLGKWPYFWAWTAAIVEVGAGLLVVIGFLTLPAAFALLVTLLLATRCTARVKVMEQNPVDKVDCVACYMWRVEGLYIGLALIIIFAGPGAWSLDSLIWR
jgi:uncharacterized membrane protein YphA (DoxX/SURF4 family)